MIETFKTEETKWLSNMYPCRVNFRGMTFHSVEAAYKSAQSDDEDWKSWCSKSHNAYDVKAKAKKQVTISDWELVKVDVMRECLRSKYNDNPELKEKLIATKYEYIQEGNTWGDTFWGYDLRKEEGQNKLGYLIMEIRTEILLNQ